MSTSTIEFKIPWERYGLIAAVVDELQGKCPQLGKTVLQKVIYLLQELTGVPCGYRFQLYTYGPFTADLLQDLDQVESLGGVEIHQVVSGTGGFTISPGEKNAELKEKAAEILETEHAQDAVARIAADFGGSTARDLELSSTIVYVVRDLEKQDKPVTRGRVGELVSELKPKFSAQEIESAIENLVGKKYVTMDVAA